MDNPHLQGLTLADSYPGNAVQVNVLISDYNYYLFVTGICKRGENPESLVAVESLFIWILTGAVDSYSKHTSPMLTMVENNEVTAIMRLFRELESVGITETVNPAMSQEEELAVNRDLKHQDGRWRRRRHIRVKPEARPASRSTRLSMLSITATATSNGSTARISRHINLSCSSVQYIAKLLNYHNKTDISSCLS